MFCFSSLRCRALVGLFALRAGQTRLLVAQNHTGVIFRTFYAVVAL